MTEFIQFAVRDLWTFLAVLILTTAIPVALCKGVAIIVLAARGIQVSND